MKTKLFYRLLLIAVFFGFWGCTENLQEQEKYQKPEWLKGKIYTQIEKEEDLGTFISCLEKTQYDTILNTSGSYTVFAPTNEAFNKFFQNQPYNSVEDMSAEELEALVESQIIYNAWTKNQFQSVDYQGWIDPESEYYNEPRGYKRKTLYRQENKTYPVRRKGNRYQIVEPSEATREIKAYTQSSKYSPIFFQEYLDIYNLKANDYEFYFSRSFDAEKLYFAGAEFYNNIPAENGFIYKTDRVVNTLPNGEQILEKGHDGHTYDKFLNWVHQFSELRTNLEATYDQAGAEQGLDIDTLYNLEYPELVFNIRNELTGNTDNPRFTVREHHGLMAPTDQAFDAFLNEYLSRWGDYKDIPRLIKRIFVNTHMSRNAVYPTDLNQGFLNGEGDSVMLNTGNIIQKTYGSNCTFLGLNQAIVPRVIKSVCRPMYLSREYETMMYAVEQTKVLSALKKPNANYAFYIPSDRSIGLSGDSSLRRVVDDRELNLYHFESWDMANRRWVYVNENNLRKKILNQIAVRPPRGNADKEFIRNLGGNFIEVNNDEGTVEGSRPSTFGRNGSKVLKVEPEPLYPGEPDNGEIYKVNTWFNYLKGRDYYGMFLSSYPEFFDLLKKAGLYNPSYYNFPFLIDGEYYTVFIPSSQALEDYQVDTLSKPELRKFIKYHFVRGDLIFTDGSKPAGKYTTSRQDESSTEYMTKYSQLNIRPKPDVIEILDKNGQVYLEIPQQEGETNQMVTYDTNEGSTSKWDYITTGVIHNIDKVLIKDSLQAK